MFLPELIFLFKRDKKTCILKKKTEQNLKD